MVHYLKHTFMKTNFSGYRTYKFSLLIIKDKSFALSDILVLLVVNFQDAFGPHKAESSHASSPKRRLLVFKQRISKENSHSRKEKGAAKCPRHRDRV